DHPPEAHDGGRRRPLRRQHAQRRRHPSGQPTAQGLIALPSAVGPWGPSLQRAMRAIAASLRLAQRLAAQSGFSQARNLPSDAIAGVDVGAWLVRWLRSSRQEPSGLLYFLQLPWQSGPWEPSLRRELRRDRCIAPTRLEARCAIRFLASLETCLRTRSQALRSARGCCVGWCPRARKLFSTARFGKAAAACPVCPRCSRPPH